MQKNPPLAVIQNEDNGLTLLARSVSDTLIRDKFPFSFQGRKIRCPVGNVSLSDSNDKGDKLTTL